MIKIPQLVRHVESRHALRSSYNRWHHKKRRNLFFLQINGIYIIDLRKTQEQMQAALEFMSKLVSEGKSILFVAPRAKFLSLL
jgi:small subunit ribosomal protein S2